MDREEIKDLLYERFIKPTENKEKHYAGVEIEMPIVNLDFEPADQKFSQEVFKEFIEEFGFDPIAYDEDGICYSATLADNEDNLSFDCSYNNLEIALGREEDINEIDKRFKKYIGFLNEKLSKRNHTLTGFGINPNYNINIPDYIPAERYRILGRYISSAKDWADHIYQHNYNGYGTYASASQVQLDVEKDNIIKTIKAFSLVEPIKAILFSNSLMEEEPDFLGTRDIFWENGPVGLNPHNIGFFETDLETIDDLLEYLTTTSLFNVSRNGRYIHFKPIPIADYLNMNEVEGEYYEDGEFKKIKFKPEIEDIKYLRTYKYEDLTFRGTIEFRSCCNQPFSEAMSVAAFHVGLAKKRDELLEILENDNTIYHHGYNAGELRRQFVKKDWPSFVDQKQLKNLVLKVLNLSKQGLIERGYGEEKFIEPLFERAQKLKSPGRKVDEFKQNHDSLEEIIKDYAKLV